MSKQDFKMQSVERLRSPGVEQGNYRGANSRRREEVGKTHKMRAAKLAPVMAVPVLQSEAGSLRQSVTFEIDPVQGRMISVPYAKVVSVFVPVQALHALKHPDHDYPGSSDVIRELLKSGSPLFGVEAEGELSQRLGINPRPVAGTKYVSEAALIAYNAGVNFLRRKKYVKAAQLTHDNRDMVPAIYDKTVLDRFGGVLDPDDRVNGAVDLELSGHLSIHADDMPQGSRNNHFIVNEGGNVAAQTNSANGSDPNFPLYSDLSTADGARLSLRDLYIAERSDALIRKMREIVDANPQYGEEMLSNWAYGLQVDPGKQPFTIFERKVPLGRAVQPGMDGASIIAGTEVTNMVQKIEFAVPIPKTEFGGIVVTFASFLPDEIIDSQPHPILSEEWTGINFTLDEQKLDPQPVSIRELYSDAELADEETAMFYVGNNHMKRTYVSYGFGRQVDETTVENKNALFQMPVPLSVTPESVSYPEEVLQYPWPDQTAEVCTVHVRSSAIFNSPLILGPSPVEELAQVELSEEEA